MKCIGYGACKIRARQRRGSNDRQGNPCQHEFDPISHKYVLGACYRPEGPLPKDQEDLMNMKTPLQLVLSPDIEETLKSFLENRLGILVEVSEKVPTGEVWLVSCVSGVVGKITNINTEAETYDLALKKPLEHVTVTLTPDKEDKP
jgi:hypothetical protein